VPVRQLCHVLQFLVRIMCGTIVSYPTWKHLSKYLSDWSLNAIQPPTAPAACELNCRRRATAWAAEESLVTAGLRAQPPRSFVPRTTTTVRAAPNHLLL
jgi:hypothetical protein